MEMIEWDVKLADDQPQTSVVDWLYPEYRNDYLIVRIIKRLFRKKALENSDPLVHNKDDLKVADVE